MIIFRPARATDLAQIYDVFYENEAKLSLTLSPALYTVGWPPR